MPTDDCTELVEIVKQHNRANPLLWRELAPIYPPVGVLSLEAINQLGFWDPALYSFYCADDDFSVRARKAGFKQILFEDVFCFHKSKGTLGDKSSQGLYLGRDLFKRKHGFEPWVLDAAYAPTIVQFLTKH